MLDQLFSHFTAFLTGSLGTFLVAAVGLFLAITNMKQNPRAFTMLSIGCGVILLSSIGTPVLFFLLNLVLRESNVSGAVARNAGSILRFTAMLVESLGLGLVVAAAVVCGKRTS